MRNTIGQTQEGLEFMAKLEALSEDARNHFKLVLLKLVECYIDDNTHGVLLVSKEGESQMTLVAINANEMDAADLLAQAGTFLTEVNTVGMPDKGMLN